MLKARYFYSPALFSNNAKLFVLTNEGQLFSSSQDKSNKVFLLESGINFDQFQAWDIHVENSPLLLEVTQQVAEAFVGKDDPNWWDSLIHNESMVGYLPQAC